MNYSPITFLLFAFFVLCSCTTLESLPIVTHPVSKVFHADYQKTWRATMLAMEDYPIEVENNDKGFLKTENIPIETIWKFPFEREDILTAAKYNIHIKLIKGRVKSKPVVKVRVIKKMFEQKGFIENLEQIPSSGLEEKKILYRILRELNIEQAITNYYQKSS